MVKKAFKWVFYTFLTLVLGVTLSVYLFKDRIIDRVIVEVNNYLTVPVKVQKVDIDFLYGLPNIAIAFYDVELPADKDPAVKAGKFYVILNPLEIFSGELNIERLEIVEAELTLEVDARNNNNLSYLFKSADEENLDKQDTTEAGFNLNKIILKDVKLSYISAFTDNQALVDIANLDGSFQLNSGVYESKLKAAIRVNSYKSSAWTVTNLRDIELDFDMLYDVESKRLDIKDSKLQYGNAKAGVDGNISFMGEPSFDLMISANKVSFANLAELVPGKLATIIEQYNSSGQINFEASVRGVSNKQQFPAVSAQLSLNEINLIDKTTKAQVKKLNLICQLDIDDLKKLSTGKFQIKEGRGLLQGEPFSVTFQLSNFSRPQYSGKVAGTVTTEWLLATLHYDQYKSASGQIDIAVEARKSAGKELVLKGNIDLQSVAFALNDTLEISRVNGLARFNPEGIELAGVFMKWLSSDITANGELLYNTIEAGPTALMLKADLHSGKLSIEDIVALVRGSSALFKEDSSAKSDVNLDLYLVANFDSLSFRRFKGARIGGEILYQDRLLEVIDLNGRAMGGTLRLNGKLKTMASNDDIVIQANAKTKGVYIDSLFYVFNNFSQDFIRDEHLKGRVFADVDALMYFDKNWRFRRQLLSSTAKIGIVDGQLNNFEPIMALSPYLDDKDDNLSRLRFSELINNIQVKQDTVFIPEMSIRTNVRNIALGGYHTLDQHINYQLAVPIINERVDKDEAFGAIQKSSKGSPNLLFRIKGTTSDYKVNYDLLRATGNMLKLLDITRIFRKKEEAEMDSSFLDDEEFDW